MAHSSRQTYLRHGPRSNEGSKSRLSNWGHYDPYESEERPRWWKPVAEVQISESVTLPIFRFPCAPGFIQVLSPDDIVQQLNDIPAEYLRGLSEIQILGGTQKQWKSSRSSAFHYACYVRGVCRIKIHAYPLNRLASYRSNQEVSEATLNWLQRFYLYDVLIHEIGHHNDKNLYKHCYRKREGYADAFAERFAYLRRRAEAQEESD